MHFTVKPVSYTCNLKCDYCFYLPKGKEGFLQPAVMSDSVLETFIKRYIEDSPANRVYFTWQGGEPLLAGRNFFEKAFALQKKYAAGKTVENAVQTNGTLIDDEWCSLFKQNKVLLGVSLDGPAALHDAFRKDRHGAGSHEKVMKGIECLKKHKVPFNILACVNSANAAHPMEVYNFLTSVGADFIQFSEVIETDPENRDFDYVSDSYTPRSFSVTPEAYGNFMSEIFLFWVAHDIGKVVIRQFESIISRALGSGHVSCVFENICPDNFVMEADGDIYECDQAVYPKYRLGNIRDFDTSSLIRCSVNGERADHQSVRSLRELSACRLSKHKAVLSDSCKKCIYIGLCNGGCVKHRTDKENGIPKTYFCEGYKILFKTMLPYLNTMVYLADNNIPYTAVKELSGRIAEEVAVGKC